MKLATIRTPEGTKAVRIEADAAVDLGLPDLDTVLKRDDWRAWAQTSTGPSLPLDGLDFAPVVTHPEKTLCVGLNYRKHILEMGRDLPGYPTLFAKFANALIGAHDPIAMPAYSTQVDWEAELAVVVGAPLRHATAEQALAGIAGFTVANDITARDFQYRTQQWLQGKAWEASTPVGPYLVTDVEPGEISCEVDGTVMQQAHTNDLVFTCVDLLVYISKMTTLVPGDLILTGTPGGVGHARTPPVYLTPGAEVVTTIEGIGQLRNICSDALTPSELVS